MSEGARPAAEISAPESSRATVSREPLAEQILIPMAGADSVAAICGDGIYLVLLRVMPSVEA